MNESGRKVSFSDLLELSEDASLSAEKKFEKVMLPFLTEESGLGWPRLGLGVESQRYQRKSEPICVGPPDFFLISGPLGIGADLKPAVREWDLVTNGNGVLVYCDGVLWRAFEHFVCLELLTLKRAFGYRASTKRLKKFHARSVVNIYFDENLFSQLLGVHQENEVVFRQFALQELDINGTYFGTDQMKKDVNFLRKKGQSFRNPQISEIRAGLLSSEAEIYISAILCCHEFCLNAVEINKAFLAGDSFTPPFAHENARHYFLESLPHFPSELWLEMVAQIYKDHYHFYSVPNIRDIAARMDIDIGDLEFRRWRRSITIVKRSEQGISIFEDERFTGIGNCRHCRFFPCRINLYYEGAVQDCKLFNRQDPDTFAEIIDLRAVGAHIETEAPKPSVTFQKDIHTAMSNRQPSVSVKWICQQILKAPQMNDPENWFLLGSCLALCGETKFAFIAFREASLLKRTVEKKNQKFHSFIHSFKNNPEHFLKTPLRKPQRPDQIGYLGMDFIRLGRHALASDCFSAENIMYEGRGTSHWLNLSQCSEELGEYSFAQLVCAMGELEAERASDISMRGRIKSMGERYHQKYKDGEDIGINMEARKNERQFKPGFHEALFSGVVPDDMLAD